MIRWMNAADDTVIPGKSPEDILQCFHRMDPADIWIGSADYSFLQGLFSYGMLRCQLLLVLFFMIFFFDNIVAAGVLSVFYELISSSFVFLRRRYVRIEKENGYIVTAFFKLLYGICHTNGAAGMKQYFFCQNYFLSFAPAFMSFSFKSS